MKHPYGPDPVALDYLTLNIPDTVTETMRADQLAAGRLVFLPMTEHLVEIETVHVSGGYVHVDTTRGHSFRWLSTDRVRALR